MDESTQKPVYVIGHKSPDTDSICSAIAYAHLKNQTSQELHLPKRAGQINQETKFVLEHFDTPAPDFITDVATQVKDIRIKPIQGVDSGISLRTAWTLMRDTKEATLPVVKDGQLEGIIAVKDIATANMDIYETGILSLAKTPFHNILDAIEGTMLIGNPDDVMEKGRILIGAANPELLETYVKEGDILITGDRFESQLCGIEMGAGCIVVCMGAAISKTIQKLAKENGCKLVSTPHDTYMTARLISQGTPIRYFMKKKKLITFKLEDFINDIKGTMVKIRHRDFPVLDDAGNYCGMISRRSLIDMKKKKIILVDHNERSQAVDGIEDAEILEIIDHHRLGSLETITPVFFRNQPLGCTATIVYQMYQEQNVPIPPNIAGLLCSAILSDTLMFRSPTCTDIDRAAAEALAELAGIQIAEFSDKMFRASSFLQDKSPEEIFYQDYKNFTSGSIQFGAGQITSLDQSELDALKPRILAFMEEAVAKHTGTDLLFFMLTNIMEEVTELLFAGEGAYEIVSNAFCGEPEDGSVVLPGLVSRKKQLLPKLMNAM